MMNFEFDLLKGITLEKQNNSFLSRQNFSKSSTEFSNSKSSAAINLIKSPLEANTPLFRFIVIPVLTLLLIIVCLIKRPLFSSNHLSALSTVLSIDPSSLTINSIDSNDCFLILSNASIIKSSEL